MIDAIKAALKKRRIARLTKKKQWHLDQAEAHQKEVRCWVLAAYGIDMMKEPMRWARMHTNVLWHRHYANEHTEKAEQIGVTIYTEMYP
jgi:hypothetical protein